MPHFKKQLDEEAASGEESRPPLLGYSREAAGLHDVAVGLAHLRRLMARNLKVPLPRGPVFPGELIRAEADDAEVIDLHAEIAAGQQDWRDRHG